MSRVVPRLLRIASSRRYFSAGPSLGNDKPLVRKYSVERDKIASESVSDNDSDYAFLFKVDLKDNRVFKVAINDYFFYYLLLAVVICCVFGPRPSNKFHFTNSEQLLMGDTEKKTGSKLEE